MSEENLCHHHLNTKTKGRFSDMESHRKMASAHTPASGLVLTNLYTIKERRNFIMLTYTFMTWYLGNMLRNTITTFLLDLLIYLFKKSLEHLPGDWHHFKLRHLLSL